MIVGNGAEAEMLAVEVLQGCCMRAPAMKLAFNAMLSADVEEPERSIEAAAAVVDAMAVAAGGSIWLWLPSYVVIRIDLSSARRCTCLRTGQHGDMVHL